MTNNGATSPARLLTVREALAALGIGRTTLHHLMATGELRRIKVGRRVLFEPDAIEDFIARHRDTAAPGP
jgi:excisionase family DNA binding protein